MKNHPGNFASAILPPMNPSKTVHPAAITARRVKYSRVGVNGNCSVRARVARAIEETKKIRPMIIFFVRNGVVTFLNLVFPSSSPVKKDKTTKNGRENDITFIV